MVWRWCLSPPYNHMTVISSPSLRTRPPTTSFIPSPRKEIIILTKNTSFCCFTFQTASHMFVASSHTKPVGLHRPPRRRCKLVPLRQVSPFSSRCRPLPSRPLPLLAFCALGRPRQKRRRVLISRGGWAGMGAETGNRQFMRRLVEKLPRCTAGRPCIRVHGGGYSVMMCIMGRRLQSYLAVVRGFGKMSS